MSTTAKKPLRKTQHLPPKFADRCAACGQKVYFNFIASKKQSGGRFRIVYLRCPNCGAKASRLVEIVAPPDD